MFSVHITKCADYDRERVTQAVAEALRGIPIPDVTGKRLLLKPNLLSSDDGPEAAVNTHPEVVRAAALFFKGLNPGRIYVGDSCGSLSKGSTRRAMEVSGIDKIAAELDLELLNVDLAPARERAVPNGRMMKSVVLPRVLEEIEVVVTLPKMKTHELTLLTGAVKNQYGLMPGRHKKDAHLVAPHPRDIAELLVDLLSVVRPRVALMDGIVSMEGKGPAAGKPRKTGVLIAGDDAAAVDAVTARIMGMTMREVETLRIAAERGLGPASIEEIKVSGARLDEVAAEDFEIPRSFAQQVFLAILPVFVMRWAFDVVGRARAVVLKNRCVLCGECVTNCPAKALRLEKGRILVNEAACISCYCCTEVCRHKAIELRRSSIARGLKAAKSLIPR